jgi:AraC-like DNA-binding protein
MRKVADLVPLVRRHATVEGRSASAVPGVWFYRWDRPVPLVRARSTTMSVGLAVQGRKRVLVGDLDLVYDRATALVLRGETEYRAGVIEASPDRPYLSLVIELPPPLVVATLLELADGHPAPRATEEARPAAFVAPLGGQVVDAAGRLLAALDDPAERRVLAPLAVREILFRLLCSDAATVLRQAAAPDGDRARIEAAMRYMEENASRRLSVAAVARQVAMSASHFAHRFRDVASVTPMRFQRHVRLERARQLMVADGKSAKEAADLVGYASAAHFTRDFKRQFGLAPRSYARAFAGSGKIVAAAPTGREARAAL